MPEFLVASLPLFLKTKNPDQKLTRILTECNTIIKTNGLSHVHHFLYGLHCFGNGRKRMFN